MPTAVVGTALGLGSLGSGIAGAISADKASRRARDQASQFFQQALQDRPNIQQLGQQQGTAIDALMRQALAGPATFTPTYVSPEQEAAQVAQLERGARRRATDTLGVLGERNARRGLFRSGIAAQQEGQALTDLNQGLNDAIANLQLGFTQQRAQEQARAFGLNQQAQAQNAGLWGSILDEASRRTGQQQQLFQAMLGPAMAALGGAGAAQGQAAQAFGNIGQSLGGMGQTALLMSMMGGGGGGSPTMPNYGYGSLSNQISGNPNIALSWGR